MMSESTSVIVFPKSRGVSSVLDRASVFESAREIQPLEFDALLTAAEQLDCASFHRRDRRDEFRVAVGGVRNTDVYCCLVVLM